MKRSRNLYHPLLFIGNLLMMTSNAQQQHEQDREQHPQSWVDKTKETTKQELAAMFGEGQNSTTFIVVCAALGVILLVFVLSVALCCARRKKRKIAKMKKRRIESSSSTTTTTLPVTKAKTKAAPMAKAAVGPTKAEPVAALTGKSSTVRKGGERVNQQPVALSRKDLLPMNYSLPQSQAPQNYFGIIQPSPNDMDDVSTLGDPFMMVGGGVTARMDADNTVGESMISSQQQLYIYGVGQHQTNSGNESRMGGTTIFSGSKNMLFGEDHTLEEIYEDGVDVNSSTDEIITVMAPKGPLGIVLDNPHGAIPVVYAVKDTSSLKGKVRVGDLLLSVDEVDCRGMSSQNVSKFLNSRSQNIARKMVLSRNFGIVTGEAV